MSKRVSFTVGMGLLALLVTYGTLVFLSRTTLLVDGQTYAHYSIQKGTVKDLLDGFHVVLGSADIVQPGLNEKLRWGERVRVTRVRETVGDEREVVDFVLNWKRRTSRNLRKVEIQEGYRKTITHTVRRIFHDGVEFENQKTVKQVRKIPVKRLAFLNDLDHPTKIYDLSQTKKITLVATCYWIGDPQVPGVITFSGHHVERGLVAVDPSVVPLGWRLYIPGYGYAYSSDTGSAIKGNRIDLFVENKKVSLQWEYKKVDVYLLEKAREW